MTPPVLAEGARCPAEGCHWVLVWCCGTDHVPGDDDGHRRLICLGCGQDADQAQPDASYPCDCTPADQPEPDEPNYRP